MSDTDKCPLCGGKVLYRGFTALECNSRQEECRNGTDKAVARNERTFQTPFGLVTITYGP